MKKIFVLLAALVFVVSVFVGCGGSKKQETTKPTTITQQNINNNKTDKASANVSANSNKLKIDKNGKYSDKESVAKYIYQYKTLPSNYITKGEAKKLGWQTKGTLDKVAPGRSIGGDRYGDYENKLPKASGRKWTECDIDYVKGNRNAKRIIFSNDGLIYYTNDHYKTFTKVDIK